MRLIVAAVGRLKLGPERDLAARYRELFAARGLSLASVELPSDVNDFFRQCAVAGLELDLLTEKALEGNDELGMMNDE